MSKEYLPLQHCESVSRLITDFPFVKIEQIEGAANLAVKYYTSPPILEVSPVWGNDLAKTKAASLVEKNKGLAEEAARRILNSKI